MENPRQSAVIEDWPLGGSKRGTCKFQSETNSRGWRMGKTTTGKTKYTTYCTSGCIADEGGKTYILQYHDLSNAISVSRSDFKSHEYIPANHPKFAEYMQLIKESYGLPSGASE